MPGFSKSAIMRASRRAARKTDAIKEPAGKSAEPLAGKKECGNPQAGKRENGAAPALARQWRAALGWALAAALAWETVFRPIVATLRPDAALPPSLMREICSLLPGLLGLGA